MRLNGTRLATMVMLGAGVLALPAVATAQKKDRNLITREEIELSPKKTSDIYQLVRALRPHFLAPPRGVRSLGMTGVSGPPGAGQTMSTRTGGTSDPIPVVYINGMKGGDLESLKMITALDVREVRYYEPSKAESEFGPGHEGGVVAITLMISSDRKPDLSKA